MSVIDKLNYLDETKELIKGAIIDKGQTISDSDTFRSYVGKIDNIEVLNAQEKTVTPTTSQQIIEPDNNYNALSQVTINAVTSSIDNNITAENIKKDVEILGVTGSYEGSGGGEANIFAQTTEPETKKGIWLQADRTIEHIYGVDSISIAGTWEADGTYTDIPYNFDGNGASIGTDIYIFGGEAYTSRAYKYDTLTDSYTQLTSIPYQFGKGRVVAIGTDIYLFGDATYSYNTAYKYDTLTDSYTQLTTIPYSFDRGAISVVGTDVYLFGSSTQGTPRTSAYKYDTLTDTYTQLTNLPITLSGGIASAVGTDIFIYNSYKNVLKYNTSTNSYTQLTDSPQSFSNGGGVVVGTDIYLFELTYSYKYNSLSNTYTQLENVPYQFRNGATSLVGNKIYLMGGTDYRTKVQAMSLESSTFLNNSVVIGEGTSYETELYNDSKVVMPLYYAFADAWFYTTANGIETDIPTYYGNGTSWVKIKN